MSNFNASEFRNALATFATGVTIITTQDSSGMSVGMTASSFNSVSLNPPLVLWSVEQEAHGAKAFIEGKYFCINVLSAEQVQLSNKFAQQGNDKFSGIDSEFGLGGCHMLKGSVCQFQCSAWAVYEGGDHAIIVAEVQSFATSHKRGLVFAGGSYATAEAIAPPPQVSDGLDSMGNAVDDLLLYHLSAARKQLAGVLYLAVEEAGLSVTGWRILANLYDQDQVDISRLHFRILSGQREAREAVESLQSLGWLDYDGQSVSATEAGRKKVARLLQIAKNSEQQALSNFPTNTRKQLIEQLRALA
jgi:flavin reductase (DIM6/NTAB) family NADH-FMN oxidoreductase RutF/DNA-binding MarR family transcriptional regulator